MCHNFALRKAIRYYLNMSKFVKGNWTTDADSVRLSMPIAKVDKEKRTVSGFATLDNIDSQGDVVTKEASAKAFARARGNLREMHQPIAVGKIVDFKEEEFFDTETGEFYRGIYVTARVSTGAEDTWQKVLDETLTGFSIGGEINEATNEFVKEAGRTVRFITDYDLVELSLVDNPANQLANIFSIQKAANGDMVVKGMAAETVVENVFICKKDVEVKISTADSESCIECGDKMENAGWFEAGDDRAEKAKVIVAKFLNPAEVEAAPDHSEGGVEMGKKDTDVTKATEENPKEAEAVEAEEVESEEEATEEAAEVEETDGPEEEEADASPDEVEDDEAAIAKKIDDLKESIQSSLEKTRTETSEQVSELEKKIDEIHKSFETKTSELETKLDGFGNQIQAAKSRLAEFEKALDDVNSSEAVRKSADLEESPERVQKASTGWNGAFSGRRSRFSVDQQL